MTLTLKKLDTFCEAQTRLLIDIRIRHQLSDLLDIDTSLHISLKCPIKKNIFLVSQF